MYFDKNLNKSCLYEGGEDIAVEAAADEAAGLVEDSNVEKKGCRVEAEDRCCLCIPIKIGVRIIFVSTGIFHCVLMTLVAITFFSVLKSPIGGFICLGLALPYYISCYLFYLFVQEDTKETRGKLVCGAIFCIVGGIIQPIWNYVRFEIFPKSTG